jgi:hypothetical protein
MHEIRGELFRSEKADVICITTNGFVKRDKTCVMGRGCAAEAVKLWPGIELLLGQKIFKGGNEPHLLTEVESEEGIMLPRPVAKAVPYHIVSFPVKPVWCELKDLLPRFRAKHPTGGSTSTFPGWMSQAKLEVIETSAARLSTMADMYGWQSIVIPKPGCGAGGLKWEDVKPSLQKYLDDRFWIIDFPLKS